MIHQSFMRSTSIEPMYIGTQIIVMTSNLPIFSTVIKDIISALKKIYQDQMQVQFV